MQHRYQSFLEPSWYWVAPRQDFKPKIKCLNCGEEIQAEEIYKDNQRMGNPYRPKYDDEIEFDHNEYDHRCADGTIGLCRIVGWICKT